MSIVTLVDPHTKAELSTRKSDGQLFRDDGASIVLYKNHGGCYDFVRDDSMPESERRYYADKYSESGLRQLNPQLVEEPWLDPLEPWYQTLLKSLGRIEGSTILLVGNERSVKELLFLKMGATVVFTDLSLEGVQQTRRELERSEYYSEFASRAEFHAVDAMHLPFADESFDVVYGCAFVHHLDDKDTFLSEVHRCLKPGGICRFFDQADAPLWSKMKATILRPLYLFSHWRQPRSPEDLRAELRSDFNEAAIRERMVLHKFDELLFWKEWFFLRLAHHHFGKVVGWKRRWMRMARPGFALLKALDRVLSNSRWMKNNQLALVWGYKKSTEGIGGAP
jgi:ubiquinone/menaquinone biosynthesis C-methylase UbiE